MTTKTRTLKEHNAFMEQVVRQIQPEDFTKFDWDDVTAWTPTWKDIRGKAHFYKTAQRRSDGKFVGLRGVVLKDVRGAELARPLFTVCDDAGLCNMEASELCNFCL